MGMVAVVAAMGLGGCGLELAQVKPARSAPPSVQNHEVWTPPGPDETAPVTTSPQAALARFALVYINWTASNVKAQLLRLSSQCVGQARTALELAAAQTGADPELKQAGIANRGTVEAVAPLAGDEHAYVVITRERTSASDSFAYQGLTAAWHLTEATVARRGRGWVISAWRPQS